MELLLRNCRRNSPVYLAVFGLWSQMPAGRIQLKNTFLLECIKSQWARVLIIGTHWYLNNSFAWNIIAIYFVALPLMSAEKGVFLHVTERGHCCGFSEALNCSHGLFLSCLCRVLSPNLLGSGTKSCINLYRNNQHYIPQEPTSLFAPQCLFYTASLVFALSFTNGACVNNLHCQTRRNSITLSLSAYEEETH